MTNHRTDCSKGRYGPNCEQPCHCKDQGCNQFDGVCDSGECSAGWKGSNCQLKCDDGFWGENCASECGNCLNVNATCHHISGWCLPKVNATSLCQVGFMPPLCQEPCNGTFWGEDCSNECHCFEGALCDPVIGECPDVGVEHVCEQGWTGLACNATCEFRKFGFECARDCGSCFGNNTCSNVNGECSKPEGGESVCEAGFSPPMCLDEEKSCPAGFFGADCESVCRCEVEGSCDAATGRCSEGGCSSGWSGEK